MYRLILVFVGRTREHVWLLAACYKDIFRQNVCTGWDTCFEFESPELKDSARQSCVLTDVFRCVFHPGVRKACPTEFCSVVHTICGSSEWDLLHVTLLASNILGVASRSVEKCAPFF